MAATLRNLLRLPRFSFVRAHGSSGNAFAK
jgi:hypothetical protein